MLRLSMCSTTHKVSRSLISFETYVGLEQSRVCPTVKFSLLCYNHILLKHDNGNFEMVLYISTGHYTVTSRPIKYHFNTL